MRAVKMLLLSAVLLTMMVPSPSHASGGNTTILSVTPSRIQQPASGNTFSANITLYLPSGISIGAYDISVKANPVNGSNCNPQCPLSVTGIQSGNLFPQGYIEIANCVNGSGTGCGASDGGGVAHSAEVYGPGVSGPLNATVFSIQFQILRSGSEGLDFINDTLVNGDNAAQDLPHSTLNGLFSNVGLTTFFNVATAIPIIAHPVSFDASETFNSNNQSPSYKSSLNYTWAFGDSSPSKSEIGLVSPTHIYNFTGTYTVSLTVTDEYKTSSSFQRTISVNDDHGIIELSIVDQTGANVNWNITVQFYNGSTLIETLNRNPSVNSIIISRLSPGTYVMTFSGYLVTSLTKSEDVVAGWTTVDSVGLTIDYPVAPTSPDTFWIQVIIVVGVIGTGSVLGTFALLRRRSRKKAKKKSD